MHTGTHLIRDVILKDHDKHVFHVSEHLHRLNCDPEELRNNPVVSPLRHPRRVAESWKRRGSDLNTLRSMWISLMHNFAPFVDVFICIDSPARDRQLGRLNKILGTSITTDWPVEGSRANTEGISIDLCPEVPNQFIEFYDACRKT